jgi:hypothetical protein
MALPIIEKVNFIEKITVNIFTIDIYNQISTFAT